MAESLVSLTVCMQQSRKSKCSALQCQLAITSLSLAFLTHHSVFPPLLFVQLYRAAEKCFRPLVFSVSLYYHTGSTLSVSHVNVSCSPHEDVCVPIIQRD